MTDNPLEIPQTLRDLAEENMRQAHAAYEKLIEFVTRSLNAWTSQMPSNPLTAGFKDVQNRAMEFATDNAEVSLRVRRQDQQRADAGGGSEASDAVCSRPDAGFRHAHAGALHSDRRLCSELPTRLIFLE